MRTAKARSDCTFALSDQSLRCPLADSLATVKNSVGKGLIKIAAALADLYPYCSRTRACQ